MKIERKWAMPNKWTFKIPPIRDLMYEEMGSGFLLRGLWCDPFAGENSPAQETNDLNPDRPTKHHMDALSFLREWPDEHFDGVLFDPPYSMTQAAQVYASYGKDKLKHSVSNMGYWKLVKDEIARITKKGGKVICYGWNSNGLGKSRHFVLQRLLTVAHGGSKNDTIVTVETKSTN